MKQKNLILMVVAVGCGLAAAFLTARMSGGQAAPPPQQREVLVAAKDLNPPTKFTKDSIKDLIKRKLMAVETIPENVIENEEELIEMSLVRPVNNGIFIQKSDVSKNGEMPVPIGKDGIISVKLPLEVVTPFIKPTSRINLMGTVTNRNTQTVSGTVLIPNMHVMAVDSDYIPAPGAPMGRMQVQVITLAVTNDEARLIRMAQQAGVQMSCLLISKDSEHANDTNADWSFDEVVAWINKAGFGDGSVAGTSAPPAPPPAAPTTVKVPVAVVDLPAGTELTDEIINTKFKIAEQLSAPENAVLDLKSNIGRFLSKEVAANSFIPRGAITNSAPMAKAGGDDATSPKAKGELPEPKLPVKEVEKRPTREQSIAGPSGSKTYRYEQQDDGKWKLLGEVLQDGTVMAQDGTASAPAQAAPADEKKTDPRIS